MAINITYERLLEIVTRTKEYYKFMEQVDEEDFKVCGYGTTFKPEIHLFNKEDFLELAKFTGSEITRWRSILSIMIEGVKIFTVDSDKVVSDE